MNEANTQSFAHNDFFNAAPLFYRSIKFIFCTLFALCLGSCSYVPIRQTGEFTIGDSYVAVGYRLELLTRQCWAVDPKWEDGVWIKMYHDNKSLISITGHRYASDIGIREVPFIEIQVEAAGESSANVYVFEGTHTHPRVPWPTTDLTPWVDDVERWLDGSMACSA